MMKNDPDWDTACTLPIRKIPLDVPLDRAYRMSATIHLHVHTTTHNIGLAKSPGRQARCREQSLRITTASPVTWHDPTTFALGNFEGRPVAAASHRVIGSASCSDLGAEVLHLEDQVSITVLLELVEIGFALSRDETCVRVHSWRVVLALVTPFDDNVNDDGIQRHRPLADDTSTDSTSAGRSGAGASGSVEPAPCGLLAAGLINLNWYCDLEPWTFLRCPNREGLEVLNRSTGELFSAGCYRLNCFVCVRTRAWRAARAIGMSRPTLTCSSPMSGRRGGRSRRT